MRKNKDVNRIAELKRENARLKKRVKQLEEEKEDLLLECVYSQ